MRYGLIWLLDRLEHWILQHRFMGACEWLCLHPWWDTRGQR